MRKLIALAVVVVVVVAAIVFVPKVVHTCDSCDTLIFGAGYEPSLVESLLSSEDKVVCRDCAEEQHALEIALGASVEDYKRELFD